MKRERSFFSFIPHPSALIPIIIGDARPESRASPVMCAASGLKERLRCAWPLSLPSIFLRLTGCGWGGRLSRLLFLVQLFRSLRRFIGLLSVPGRLFYVVVHLSEFLRFQKQVV